MRNVVMVFGMTGFFLALTAGFLAERSPDLILRDAAIVCLVAALVGKWFWQWIDRAALETAELRRRSAFAEAATLNDSSPPAGKTAGDDS
jgi:hypothetical protein